MEVIEEPTVQPILGKGALKGRDIHLRLLAPPGAQGNAR
jgi:hypothetical protein